MSRAAGAGPAGAGGPSVTVVPWLELDSKLGPGPNRAGVAESRSWLPAGGPVRVTQACGFKYLSSVPLAVLGHASARAGSDRGILPTAYAIRSLISIALLEM